MQNIWGVNNKILSGKIFGHIVAKNGSRWQTFLEGRGRKISSSKTYICIFYLKYLDCVNNW